MEEARSFRVRPRAPKPITEEEKDGEAFRPSKWGCAFWSLAAFLGFVGVAAAVVPIVFGKIDESGDKALIEMLSIYALCAFAARTAVAYGYSRYRSKCLADLEAQRSKDALAEAEGATREARKAFGKGERLISALPFALAKAGESLEHLETEFRARVFHLFWDSSAEAASACDRLQADLSAFDSAGSSYRSILKDRTHSFPAFPELQPSLREESGRVLESLSQIQRRAHADPEFAGTWGHLDESRKRLLLRVARRPEADDESR